MKPNVLITGGSGLLALNWALAIRDRYPVILGLHKREISLAGVQTRRIDLESTDHIIRAFETAQPQIVVHTAGLTSVEQCESDPHLAQRVNVGIAANVAEATARLGLSLVHISTDHLFSGIIPLVDEICPVAPVNVYGRTKAEAESRVLEAHPQALVVRTNFYGWGTSYRHSFSDAIIKALRAGKEITLFRDVFYTPILVETVALAVHELLDLKVGGIFNVVGDERISKYEFGLKLARKFKLDASLIRPGYITDQPSLVKRPHDMSLSNQKICKLLGRKLGDVKEHLARLQQQEQNGLAQELAPYPACGGVLS